jgi:hypothetical protein
MNLGGEQPGNTGKTIRNTGSSILIPGDAPVRRLQNLSNYPARPGRGSRSTVMAINKRVRVLFYALATLEMILLSAFYAWGRVAH